MDAKFQSLPPLKRFRLLQQELKKQQQELLPLSKPESKPNKAEKQKSLPLSPSNLPSKKRKQSRGPFFDLNEGKENLSPITPPISSSNLPAKKRMQPRDLFFDLNEGKENFPPITPPTPYCLPAKKRIWAFKPDSSPINDTPSPSFDLNVEYNPFAELTENPAHVEIEWKNEEVEEEEEEDHDTVLKGSSFQIEIESKDEEMIQEGDDDDGILCAVCESTDGDESDPIVFCDGCDLMVHSNCYGNPLIKGIPEGEWFCHPCLNSQPSTDKNSHKCCLCPDSGGAMKPTTDGRWAHIVCAVLVPEVYFEDPEGRDGIDCSMIPKRRWKEKCYVCKERKGCAIECSELKCGLAFHVTCGLKQDLSIELKQGRKNNGGIVAGFCKKHTALWKKQQQTGKFKIVARDEEN